MPLDRREALAISQVVTDSWWGRAGPELEFLAVLYVLPGPTRSGQGASLATDSCGSIEEKGTFLLLLLPLLPIVVLRRQTRFTQEQSGRKEKKKAEIRTLPNYSYPHLKARDTFLKCMSKKGGKLLNFLLGRKLCGKLSDASSTCTAVVSDGRTKREISISHFLDSGISCPALRMSKGDGGLFLPLSSLLFPDPIIAEREREREREKRRN